MVCHSGTGELRSVWRTSLHIEAPNWTMDGKGLIFNSGGLLYRIAVEGKGEPVLVPTGFLDNLNNDHCLSPDGTTLYLSANDGHLYRLPIEGGTPVKISNDHDPARRFRYYLHGVSPDGTTLVYVGLEKQASGKTITNLYTLPARGGRDVALTDVSFPVDGPEYTPDGSWIYFNSEQGASVPGHAQIFRMRPDGSHVSQITHDSRVNWFPHMSPDGACVVYLSFPAGTIGHPANKRVALKSMDPDGRNIRVLDRFNGGQGTINVNSWAPDSQRFAYVRYPKP